MLLINYNVSANCIGLYLRYWPINHGRAQGTTCIIYNINFLLNTLKVLQMYFFQANRKKESWETSWIAETVIAIQQLFSMNALDTASTCSMLELKLHRDACGKLFKVRILLFSGIVPDIVRFSCISSRLKLVISSHHKCKNWELIQSLPQFFHVSLPFPVPA